MACVQIVDEKGNVTGHVCGVGRPAVRRYLRCWNCKVKRAIVQVGEPYSYYSPHFTCLTCGDGWSDGYRDERPFCRGWRQDRIRTAKRYWAHAITKAQYNEIGRQLMALYREQP